MMAMLQAVLNYSFSSLLDNKCHLVIRATTLILKMRRLQNLHQAIIVMARGLGGENIPTKKYPFFSIHSQLHTLQSQIPFILST